MHFQSVLEITSTLDSVPVIIIFQPGREINYNQKRFVFGHAHRARCRTFHLAVENQLTTEPIALLQVKVDVHTEVRHQLVVYRRTSLERYLLINDVRGEKVKNTG